MNTPFLCLMAVTAAGPPVEVQHTIYRPQSDLAALLASDEASALVVRMQDSPFYGGEAPPTYDYGSPGLPPGMMDPSGGADPYMQPFGGSGDPWLGGGQVAPYANPYGAAPQSQYQYSYGANGPQPYHFGWNTRHDFTYMPEEGTSPDVGDFGIFAYDLEKEFVKPTAGNWVFSIAPQFNYRSWDGPRGTPGMAGLPPNAYRFGLGLKLATPDYGGWNAEFGFNPAVATDFNSSLSSDGVLFDGHAVLFWRSSPQWMWALGAAYWDRVDDLIVPYAGVVWTPNSVWELRLLFPQPRVTAFLGTPFGIPTWAYVTGEYHVEAYQVDTQPAGVETRAQFEDWRILGGLRWEAGAVTAFAEAGWVLERRVEFENVGTNFDVSDGLIGRVGFRY